MQLKRRIGLKSRPLRVLEPPVRRATRVVLDTRRMLVVLGLTLSVLLLPMPEGLSASGQRAMALFVFTAGVLALEPVALPIAALLVPVARVALGGEDLVLGTARDSFLPFARPVVFLILGSLFLAEGLRKQGLTRRLALSTIVWSGGSVKKLLFGLMAIAAALGMWVENTAVTAMLVPVALAIAGRVRESGSARQLLVLLLSGVAVASSVGGMSTIIGSAANAVTAGIIEESGYPFTFIDWVKLGLPATLFTLPLSWAILVRAVPNPIKKIDVKGVGYQLGRMGRVRGSERELVVIMAVAIVLWMGGAPLSHRLGGSSDMLSAAVVALAAVGVLFIRGIIDWDDVRGVSWGVIFVIGAGLTLSDALGVSGAGDWLASLIVPFVSGQPYFVAILLLTVVGAVLTNLMNNTTIAAMFVPILIFASGKSGVDLGPLALAIPVALSTAYGYSLPSASGRCALLAATGIISRGEMLRYGVYLAIPSLLALNIYFALIEGLGFLAHGP